MLVFCITALAWIFFAIQPVAAFTNYVHLPDGLSYGKKCKASELSGKCTGDFTQQALLENKPIIDAQIYDIQAVSELVYKITIEVRTEAMSFDELKQLRFNGLLTPGNYISGEEMMYSKDAKIANIDDPSHFAFTLVVNGVSNGNLVCSPTFQIQYEWCAWDTTTSKCSLWPYKKDYWYYSDCPADVKDIQPVCWEKLCAQGDDPSSSTTLTDVQTETTSYTDHDEESTSTTITPTSTATSTEKTSSTSSKIPPETPDISTTRVPNSPVTPDISTTKVPSSPATPDISTTKFPSSPATPDISTTKFPSSPATPDISTTKFPSLPATPDISTITPPKSPATPDISTIKPPNSPATPDISTIKPPNSPATPDISTIKPPNSPATPDISTIKPTNSPLTPEISSTSFSDTMVTPATTSASISSGATTSQLPATSGATTSELPIVTEVPEYTDEVFTVLTTLSNETEDFTNTNPSNSGTTQSSRSSTLTADPTATTVSDVTDSTQGSVTTQNIVSTPTSGATGNTASTLTSGTTQNTASQSSILSLDPTATTISEYTTETSWTETNTGVSTLPQGSVTTFTSQSVESKIETKDTSITLFESLPPDHPKVVTTTIKTRVPIFEELLTTDVETESFIYASKTSITLTGDEAIGYVGHSSTSGALSVSSNGPEEVYTNNNPEETGTGSTSPDIPEKSVSSALPGVTTIATAEGNSGAVLEGLQSLSGLLFIIILPLLL